MWQPDGLENEQVEAHIRRMAKKSNPRLQKMNWRRGLLRLWLIASVFWIIGVSWFGYANVIMPRNKAASENACFEARRLDAALGNPFDCFAGNTTPAPLAGFIADTPRRVIAFDDLIPLSAYWHYIPIAFLPVFVVLILGMATGWIFAGFRRNAA